MELYKKYIKEEVGKDGQLKTISFFNYENYNFGYDVVEKRTQTK